jgi:pilus assembly protein CpaC
MRRITSAPRSLWRFLLAGLCLSLSTSAALAQEVVPVIPVQVNQTREVTMSKKQLIAEVRNENPKICRVQSIIGNPKAVLITGLMPGVSRVVFTDADKNAETFDVSVTTEDRAIREQLRKEFLEQMFKTVPGAKLDVLLGDKTTIITGTAPDQNAISIIQQAARASFGPDVVNAVHLPGQEPTLNVPRVQQVELDVMVAVVNRSKIRNMSFNWVVNQNRWFLSSLLGTASTSNPLSFANSIATGIAGATQSAAGNPNLQFGYVGNKGAFTGFLEALRTDGLLKVLASPRVVTLSGQKAHINSGGETPIVLATSVGSPPTVTYKPFGTVVDFTPVVMENGRIQLIVSAELSDKNDANGLTAPGISAPGFDVRKAESVVLVEDGQTLAIGGLIQNKINAVSSKVPVLGEIPFVGVAFSSTRFSESEEELLILVTPRLVDPLSCCQIPRYLPGRETRAPDDFELYLTQILEAPRGQRDMYPDGRYRGAHMNGPTAGIYPCGANGSCGWNRGGNCANGNCGAGNGGATLSSMGGVTNTNPLAISTPSDTTPDLPGGAPATPASLPAPEVPVRDATVPMLPPSNEVPVTDPRFILPPAAGPMGGDSNR